MTGHLVVEFIKNQQLKVHTYTQMKRLTAFCFWISSSHRSAENKMDSSNLAVIFAPNLLQLSETDKISAHTEKKLRLQAAVLQTFIDHAEDIGMVIVNEITLEDLHSSCYVATFK